MNIERFFPRMLVAAGLLVLLGTFRVTGEPAAPPAPGPETRPVAAGASFNGEPFAYTLQLRHTNTRHRIYDLTYPSPLKTDVANNNTVPAEYYVPINLKDGEPRRPAVVILHILNGNYELERMLCTILAESGMPAILFKLPYYDERSPVAGRNVLIRDPVLFTACMKQAVLDVRRTVDVLADRPEVDPGRIGVAGISLGAIMAGSACGAEPRLQRAALILGGGDLRRIVNEARETRTLRENLAQLPAGQRQAAEAAIDQADPLTHAAALRRLAGEGRLLMVNAAEDEVIPRDCTNRLAAAAGMQDQVVWIKGVGHYTALAGLPEILRNTVAFFARDLPPGITAPPAPSPAKEQPPMLALTAFLQQMTALLTQPPRPGRCHYLDLQADLTLKDGKTTPYRLTFVRGTNGQFSLTASPVPEAGTLAIGCGDYPWLLAKNGRLFAGRQALDPAVTVANFMDPQHLLRLQLLAGAAMALALAPDVFAQYVQVTDEPGTPGERVLGITLTHKKAKGTGRLHFRRDTLTPTTLSFTGEGVSGTVTFRMWSLNAVSSPELYHEPGSASVQEVPQQDLLRMFAAAFNFLMEKAQ
ncbi:MAG: dienelactone hydrolase family protein [Lentisphaeria bacterium]